MSTTDRPGSTPAARLRRRRLAIRLSQRELGERVDCSKQYIWDVEHGHRMPDVPWWLKTAIALGLDKWDLIPEQRATYQ